MADNFKLLLFRIECIRNNIEAVDGICRKSELSPCTYERSETLNNSEVDCAGRSEHSPLFWGNCNPQAVKLRLRSARQAVEAVGAAAAAVACGRHSSFLREAAAATDALAFIASAVRTPGSQPLHAEAAQAFELVTRLVRSLAQYQQLQALQCATAARHEAVSAGGDLRAAVHMAVQAKEGAAVAMWVACMGGMQVVRELRDDLDAAMRAADEVLDSAEKLAAGAAAAMSSGIDTLATAAAAGDSPVDLGQHGRIEEATVEEDQSQAACVSVSTTGFYKGTAWSGEAVAAGEPGLTALEVAFASIQEDGHHRAPQAASACSSHGGGCSTTLLTSTLRPTDELRRAAAAGGTSEPGATTLAAGSIKSAVSLRSAAEEFPAMASAGQAVATAAAALRPASDAAEGPSSATAPEAVAVADTGLEPAATPFEASSPVAASAEDISNEAAAGATATHDGCNSRLLEEPENHDVFVATSTSAVACAAQLAPLTAAAPVAVALEGTRAPESRPLPRAAAIEAHSGPNSAAAALLTQAAVQQPHFHDGGEQEAGGAPGPLPSLPDRSLVAVRCLEAAVEQATEDGQLPIASLKLAGAAVRVLVETLERFDPEQRAGPATLAALTDPKTRCAVSKLWSYGIRQLCSLLDSTEAEASACAGLEAMQDTFQTLELYNQLLLQTLNGDADRPDLRSSLAEEAARLWVRTDLMQCLSCVLSKLARSAAAEIAAGAAVPPGREEAGVAKAVATAEADAVAAAMRAPGDESLAMAGTSQLHESGRVVREFAGYVWRDARMRLAGELAHVLAQLVVFSWENDASQETLRSLRKAILSSRVVEHCVRALVLTWHVCRQKDAETATSAQTAAIVEKSIVMLMPLLASLTSPEMRVAAPEGNSLRVWVDVLLLGPCVQHFLLLHTVSQLHAVDGGPTYGLPAGALLPLMTRDIMEDKNLEAAGRAKRSSGNSEGLDAAARREAPMVEVTSGGAPTVTARRLSTMLMSNAFQWWADNRARPCSDRDLLVVCERALVAASVIWEAAAQAADGDRSDVVLLSRGSDPCLYPASALPLGEAALKCAVALVRKGSAGDGRELWAPLVRLANTVAKVVSVQPFLGISSYPLRVLVTPPRLLLSSQQADANGFLTAQPSPDLAALLEAGYVPSLERAIRIALHKCPVVCDIATAALPPDTSSSSGAGMVLQHVTSLLDDGQAMACLIAYGELSAVAALLATTMKTLGLALKAFARGDVAAEVLDAFDTELRRAMDGVVNLAIRLPHLLLIASGRQHARWWLRQVANRTDGDDVGDRVISRSSEGGQNEGGRGATAAGPGAGSSAGPGAYEVDGLGRTLTLVLRVSLLTGFTLIRCLPALRRLADIRAHEAGSTSRVVRMPCMVTAFVVPFARLVVPALVHAYLDCRDLRDAVPAGPQNAAAADAGAESVGPMEEARGPPAGASAAQAAWSWEQLLLEEHDLPGFLLQITRGVAGFATVSSEYVRLVLHVIVAFPRLGRSLLREPVAPYRTLLLWLQDELAAQRSAEPTVRHFLELAPVVADGGQPTSQDVARLRTDNDTVARMGALLPPPCVLAAALRDLRLCANPQCTNLAGDSEAGLLELRAAAGGSGSGGSTLSYCCKECGMEHRRAKKKAAGGVGHGGR